MKADTDLKYRTYEFRIWDIPHQIQTEYENFCISADSFENACEKISEEYCFDDFEINGDELRVFHRSPKYGRLIVKFRIEEV